MKDADSIVILDTLAKMAEMMAHKGEKERAAEILTIILQYPMRVETRHRAQGLYDELETELCPRVFMDARLLAEDVTLDDLARAMTGI